MSGTILLVKPARFNNKTIDYPFSVYSDNEKGRLEAEAEAVKRTIETKVLHIISQEPA